ncbi:MAG: HAD-IIA family hydrolase [Chloroflexi bacterium]|nr:HAD-IIA family hydrolase [Chloroflexota bacterium]
MTRCHARAEPVSTDVRAALVGVRALILDADGVLMYAGRPLPGAVQALQQLERASFPYRVVTNYSSAHRRTLAAGVSRSFGIPVDPRRLITAASAAAAHTARHHRGEPLFVLASADALREWDGQRTLSADEADRPDARLGAVVIGDAGDDLSFRNLNIAFRAVRSGAALVAMHRNAWWVTARGVTLDAGALVVGLEYALDRKAVVTGKPSRVVFRAATDELTEEAGRPRLRLGDIAMVGDDLRADVAGAHRAGLRGVLVLSGKTDAISLAAAVDSGTARGGARPDAVATDVGSVIEALLSAR